MSIILTLDDFDPNKKEQCIRLKKKYNITLLDLFPTVIEPIIHDYIHDIIEVILKYTHNGNVIKKIMICITNQYINYKPITISFEYYISNMTNNYSELTALVPSHNVAIKNIDGFTHFLYPFMLNKYMKLFYNKHQYLHDICARTNLYNVSYDNNTLTCWFYNNAIMQMCITNHKLFKNMIVIIKCIMKKIDKSFFY